MENQQQRETGTLRRVWYASIGAVSKAAHYGRKGFETLVDEGEKLQRQGKKKLDEVEEKAEETTREAKKTIRKTADKLTTLPKDSGPKAVAAAQPVDPIAVTRLPKVSKTMADKLHAEGIADTAELLAAAQTPQQRSDLAKRLSVTDETVLHLAHRADFARLEGIGGIYAELLEKAGVSTVKELANRNADSLLESMSEANKRSEIAGRLPPKATVEGWIAQAATLPRVLRF